MDWIEAVVVKQKCWGPGLYSIFIEPKDKGVDISFEAGQFTYLADLKNTKLFRPYSFANSPHEPILEFYYTHIRDGEFSSFLKNLKPGDSVALRPKGFGRFTQTALPVFNNLWCFATGTGLGVFLSILNTKNPWERYQKIILVHSVRHFTDLTHQEQIQAWQKDHSEKFTFIPIVTQGSFQGFNQRIPVLLNSGELENSIYLKFIPNESHAMLCGNPAMIQEVTETLQSRGCKIHKPNSPGHITFEKYWK